MSKYSTPTYQAFVALHRQLGAAISEQFRDYANFLRDVGEAPSREHILIRIDLSLGYVPGNLRWIASPRSGDMDAPGALPLPVNAIEHFISAPLDEGDAAL